MSENPDDNNLCGFLMLQESGGKWLRRFFKLDAIERSLKYHADNPDNCPHADDCAMLGEINTKYITQVAICTSKSQVENCFEITTMDDKKYYLQSTTSEGLNMWTQAIHNAAKVQVQSRPEYNTQRSRSLEKSTESSSASGDEAEGPVCYETKIIGGVVVRMPVKRSNEVEESRSGSGTFGRSNSNSGVLSQPGLKPLMEGYCTKQGQLMKNWKRRFFKLDLVKFCYYEKHTDKEPIRTIPTTDLNAARKALGSASTRDHLFEVVTSFRTFLIQADSNEQLDQWVEALSKVIISIHGKPSPASEVKPRNTEREPRIVSMVI